MKRTQVQCNREEDELSTLSTRCTVVGSQSRLVRRPYTEQDTCWSWVVCFCSSVANIIVVGLSYSYGILFPVLLGYFKKDRATTAWVGSLFLSTSFLLGPVSSNLCDRYGCKLTAIFGGILCVFGLLLTSQATTIYTMYLTLSLVVGFGSCCVFTACFIIIPRMFKKQRSLAIGIMALGPAGGFMVMAPVLQTLLDNLGWRNTFRATAGIASVICLLCCTFDSNTIDDIQDSNVSLNSSDQPSGISLSALFRNKQYVISQIASFVLYLGATNIQMFLVEFCSRLNIDASKASILYFCLGLGSAATRLITGRLCDYPRFNKRYMFFLGTLFLGTSLVCLPLSRTYNDLIVIAFICGVGEGTVAVSLIVTVMTSVSKRQQSIAVGIWLAIGAVSMAIAPPLIGVLVDKFDSFSPGFYISGAFVITSGLIPLLPGNKESKEAEQDNGSLTTVESCLSDDSPTVLVEKLSVV